MQILGKKPAFTVVHPDDESFLAAGKIWKNFKAGGQSFVLCESF